jgi:type III secretion system YscQ/HrcQ family protein
MALLRTYVETEHSRMLRRLPVGYERHIDLVRPQVYLMYLPIVMTIRGVAWRGFIETSALLASSYGAGVALPSELIEGPLLLQLAREHFLASKLRLDIADGNGIEAERVEPAGPPELLDPGQWFYRLSSNVGDFLCSNSAFVPSISIERARVGWSGLPVALTITVGVTALTLKNIRRLAVGDVVIVARFGPRVWSGARALFNATLKGNSIMVEALDSEDAWSFVKPSQAQDGGDVIGLEHDSDDLDDDMDDGDGENFAIAMDRLEPGELGSSQELIDAEPRFVPDDLPIELTFVVAEKELALTDLYQLRPGQIIELENCEHVEVRIKAGRMVVAKGELVRYGDRLAVEIDRVYRA